MRWTRWPLAIAASLLALTVSLLAASVVADSFLGVDGTNVSAHTGEIGASWAQQTGTTGDLFLASNRIRGNTQDADSNYYSSGVPASAEYDVSADFFCFTNLSGHYTTILGRMATGAKTSLYVTYSTDRFILYEEVTGTATELGNFVTTLTASSTTHVVLQIRNATLNVQINGIDRISVANPGNVAATGRGGVSAYFDGVAPATNSTGIHIDNFAVTDLTGGSRFLTLGVAE